MTFDTDTATMVYCDSTDWIAMNSLSLTNGLIAHWKLDESSGTLADSAGSYTATVSSGAPTYAQTGVIDDSLYFNGSDDLVVSDSNDWDFSDKQVTVALWFRADPSQPTNYSRFFDHYTGSAPQYGWYFSFNSPSEKIRFAHPGTDIALLVSTDTYNDDEWHHAVVTMDGAIARLYIDGVLDVSDSYSGLRDRDQDLYIGNAGANPYKGYLDDMRIYHRALSAGEVAALYAQGARDIKDGLVAHWKLDETSGTIAADSTVRGSNGTMNGGLAGTDTTTGVIGSALDFDGDDYITAGTLPTIGTSYSVSAWVKLDRNNVEQRFTNVTTSTFTLRNRTTGHWNFHWTVSGGGSSDSIQSSTIAPIGVWTHIVGTHDGATASLYVNGALDSSKAQTTSDFSGRPFTIGGLSALHLTDGVIDDVRIYNRALSPEEIANLYNYRGCNNPLGDAGDITYDTNTDVMVYCNGSAWTSMGAGPGTGGGCANPTGTAGEIVYDSNTDIMTYCDGSDWVGIGK